MTKKRMVLILALLCFQFINYSFSQITFENVNGIKASYTIEIPSNYKKYENIGANIDLKFANIEGASIVTCVKQLPSGTKDSQIKDMAIPSDAWVIDNAKANGMENFMLIKRGLITINGRLSYYLYYTFDDLYFHSITQIRNGKSINLTYTCDYSKKANYMPYIFRIVNSLK